MLKIKKVQIPKRNLPDSIDSKSFKKVWIAALQDKKSDLTELMLLLNPFLEYVLQELYFKKDSFFLLSLLSLIDEDLSKSLKKLNLFLKTKDTREEIILCIISRCRQLKKIPARAKPYMVEYYFVLDFKYAFSKLIKKQKYIFLEEDTLSHFYSDIFYLDKSFMDPWQKYLYYMYGCGYNTTEISQLTNLSRKTLIKDKEKLCQCLKLRL